MKWRFNGLYAKAIYVLFILSSVVATAAAGYKWK